MSAILCTIILFLKFFSDCESGFFLPSLQNTFKFIILSKVVQTYMYTTFSSSFFLSKMHSKRFLVSGFLSLFLQQSSVVAFVMMIPGSSNRGTVYTTTTTTTTTSSSSLSLRYRHNLNIRHTIPMYFHSTRNENISKNNNEDDDDNEWTRVQINEVIENDDHYDFYDTNDNEDDWLPDRERVRQKKRKARQYAEKISSSSSTTTTTETTTPVASAYTEDEEELIAAMGGKTRQAPREQGFLGDSTLQEICQDYSVPICYIADVLCLWGVSPPIHTQDRLGDLVTGEQAFALLEAINSLDVAALQDRYSNQSLWQICQEWDIDLGQGFQMAMKEGWSLPFGVQTNLRVEQEDELIRVLGNPLAMTRSTDDDDDEDYDWDEDESD